MPLFHIDQRSAIRRCEEQLARLPSDDPWLEHSVSREIREILDECELSPNVWSPVVVSAVMAWARAGEREAVRRVLSRAIPRAGRVAWVRVTLVVALIASGTAALASVWSVASSLKLAAALVAGVLCSLPHGGSIVRFLVALVVDGPTRRMYRRYETIKALSSGSTQQHELYRLMYADVGRDDLHEEAGFFFGKSVGLLAERAAEDGDAALLQRMFNDARSLILEERVPVGSGDGLAKVLAAAGAAHAETAVSPIVAQRLLRKLELLAPDAGSLGPGERLKTAAEAHTRHLRSSRASRWDRYAEAREVAYVAPRARVDPNVTRLSSPADKITARSRYLTMLRGFVARAIADEAEEDLARLMRDIEAYLEHRRRWRTPAPEADRTLDEILETLAGDPRFPEVAASAGGARRGLASSRAERQGDGANDEVTPTTPPRGMTFAEEVEQRTVSFRSMSDEPPSMLGEPGSLGPAGPDRDAKDGFDRSWGSWYERQLKFATYVLDGGWKQRDFANRLLLREHLGEKPRVEYLVEHYAGAFADAVAGDWQRVHDALLGRERELTAEDLAYRTLGVEPAAKIREAGAAARCAFLRERAHALIEAFPMPFPTDDWDEEELAKVSGKLVALPEIGPRDRSRWVGRTYLFAGDGGRGYYVVDSRSEAVKRVFRARDRYAELVSPSIAEDVAVIGRIRPESMPWVVDGRAARVLRVEVLAATVGGALFVDTRVVEDGESPFAGEDALGESSGAVTVAPDASPRSVMEAAIAALKTGDRQAWEALFARWWLTGKRDGKRFDSRYYDGGPIRQWMEARRQIFDEVYAIDVVEVGPVRRVLSGEELEGAPAIDEVEVEVEHIGKFPEGYRPFVNAGVTRVWTLQRKDGGPWRIVTRKAI